MYRTGLNTPYVELGTLCVQLRTSCVGWAQHPISASQYPPVELGQQSTLRFIIQVPPGGGRKYVEINSSYPSRPTRVYSSTSLSVQLNDPGFEFNVRRVELTSIKSWARW